MDKEHFLFPLLTSDSATHHLRASAPANSDHPSHPSTNRHRIRHDSLIYRTPKCGQSNPYPALRPPHSVGQGRRKRLAAVVTSHAAVSPKLYRTVSSTLRLGATLNVLSREAHGPPCKLRISCLKCCGWRREFHHLQPIAKSPRHR
jgi:hypothetical protein